MNADAMKTENAYLTNGCELLNGDQLSRSQARELQRYIQRNAHLLQYAERPSNGSHKSRKPPSSNYASVKRSLGQQQRQRVSAGGGAYREGSPYDNNEPKPSDRQFNYAHNTDSTYYPTSTVRSGRTQRSYGEGPHSRRKEVKWSDSLPDPSERARSLSPFSTPQQSPSPVMLRYGSAGNLNERWTGDNQSQNVRDRTASPAYSSLDRHRDDYNRYETARHVHNRHLQQQRREEEERSRFSGYGDRPGSGVELMPSKWHGGEIITDRRMIPKSLKPRRMYYSPIGDGVVAADGVEMKRVPKDLSPRISVTHTRVTEKGDPGRDGYNVYERSVTHSGGSDYGSEYGGMSGRNSRTAGTLSPSTENYGATGGMGSPYGAAAMGGSGTPAFDSMGGAGHHGTGGRAPSYEHLPREYMANRGPPGRDYANEPYVDTYSGGVIPLGGAYSGGGAVPVGGPSGAGYGNVGGYGSAGGGGGGGGGGMATGAGGMGPDGYGSASRGVPQYGGTTSARNYGTPTSTLGASSPADLFGSGQASNYATMASRDTYGTLHSGHSEPYSTDIGGRSRSHDALHDGMDGYGGGYGGIVDGRSSATSAQYGYRMDSPRRTEITTDYLITNPRELIHQYATTTPVAVLDIKDSQAGNYASHSVNRAYTSTIEEKYAPYPPYKGSEAAIHPNNFVRQLRDENLTISQREANRRMEPLNVKESNYDQKINEIRSRSTRGPAINEIDYLTERMMYGLQTGHPTPPNL